MNCKALAVSKSGRTLKTLLTAIVVFASMITGMAHVPSYVPANGLVGWWPFNGNANDESGNGNNGTVNGATLTSDRNGVANAAYSFDGVNDLIIAPIVNPLQSNWSISFWYNSLNTTNNFQGQNTIGLGSDVFGFGGAGYQISGQIPPGQCPGFNYLNKMYLIDASQVCGGNFLDGGIYSNSTWFHVIIIKNNLNYDLIVNNVLVASSSLLDIDIDKLIFGNRDISFQFFYGNLDDIGIWNRALTQQEITNLYTASTPPPCNTLAANLQNGLVGYWPFCGNANDESGNGNNGTVNGATLTTDRFGAANSAYSFDGNGDYIEVNHSADLVLSGNFTISAWANISNLNTFNSIISKASNNQTSVPGWVWGYSNFTQPPRMHFQGSPNFNGTTISNAGNTLQLNNWVNVVVTYDSSLSVLKYYSNNIPTDSFNINFNFANSILNLFIGNHFQNNDPNIPVPTNGGFIGKLDDIGVWDRVLTQNEITQLYTGSPCVNYQIITVTDTLIINANLSGINPVTFQNTIKVYPNPSSSQITIDFGANFNTLAGYSMRIQNAVGQTVYTTGVTQQQFTSNLNTWTGNGIYFVYLIDAQGNTVDVKKIILQ